MSLYHTPIWELFTNFALKSTCRLHTMGYNKERYRTLKNIAYHILFVIWYIVSCLPLRFLYIISSILGFLLCHVIRYRKNVVRKNIADAFPHLSERKRRMIEHRFYTHFCDIMMESVKYFSISKSEMRKRMRFKGVELIEESCRKGRSCGIYLGHYGNWEWTSSMPLWTSNEWSQCVQLYHPLENLVTDRLIFYTRQRFGGISIPANQSIREIVKCKKSGKPLIIGFVADQTPWWRDIHYWTNFLNHPETPVFTGAERIMRKFDMDVYYLDIRRIKRGYYTAEYKLITSTPKDCPEFWITEQYTRLMEETINRAPAYWLWSHKRWKRTKAEWLKITGGK